MTVVMDISFSTEKLLLTGYYIKTIIILYVYTKIGKNQKKSGKNLLLQLN